MIFSRATSNLLNDVMAQVDADIFFSFATSGRGGGGSMAPSRVLITVIFSLFFNKSWFGTHVRQVQMEFHYPAYGKNIKNLNKA